MKPISANQKVIQFLNAYLTLDKTFLLFKTKLKAADLDQILDHLMTEGVIKVSNIAIGESFRIRVYYLTKYADLVEQLEKRKTEV